MKGLALTRTRRLRSRPRVNFVTVVVPPCSNTRGASVGLFSLAGATIPPNQMGIPDFVFINDLALTSCTNPTDPNQIRDRKTLTHEVVCHWLQRLGDAAHPSATPANPCPQNLCIGGDILLAGPCQGVYNGKRPAQVPTTVQQQIRNLNQGCLPP